MKYHIKARQKKARAIPYAHKRLSLAAKKGLRPIKALTATEEKISFFGWDHPCRRKKRPAKKIHPLSVLHSIAREIELFVQAAVTGAKKLIFTLFHRILYVIESKAEAESRKKINSLAVALGALCGASVVTVATFGIMFLYLFAPYAVKHETVTVPSLEGKLFSELDGTFENINLTVMYENNPDAADGQIISQSAPAGATRRVSSESGYYDLRITVCKKEPVTIPEDIVGIPLRDAELQVKNLGLSISVSYEYSASVAKDVVISSYPKGGAQVESGSQVKLTVSLGEKETQLIVPDLEGLDESEALRRIKLSGFTVGSVSYTPSQKTFGTVISQSIRPHTYAPEGTVISVWVAST